MPYHNWGDQDFDFAEFDKATSFFAKTLQRYARLGIHTKEKYGTMRIEMSCAFQGLHGLVKPGYYYYQWPRCTYTSHQFLHAIAVKTGLSWLWWQYQRACFNIITVMAVKKWPQFKEEILDDFEFKEYLYEFVKKKIAYTCKWVSYSPAGDNIND